MLKAFLVGTYSAPFKGELVLLSDAGIVARQIWQPDGEISDLGFFPLDGLPRPVGRRALARIRDATDVTVQYCGDCEGDAGAKCCRGNTLPQRSPTSPHNRGQIPADGQRGVVRVVDSE